MKLIIQTEQMDELVNLINTLELSSKANFQNALKLSRVYAILNSIEVINDMEVSDEQKLPE